MTKKYAEGLYNRFGMRILRNPVTQEAWGLYLESPEEIPELESIWALNEPTGMEAWTEPDGSRYYRLRLPESWFDLWGFKE